MPASKSDRSKQTAPCCERFQYRRRGQRKLTSTKPAARQGRAIVAVQACSNASRNQSDRLSSASAIRSLEQRVANCHVVDATALQSTKICLSRTISPQLPKAGAGLSNCLGIFLPQAGVL